MSARIPRVEFDELESGLADALAPRVERLGYLGEFFKCTAHQPQALRAFIDFTESAKGDLPKEVVETVALTVAVYMQNEYERNQHERLSVRLGFGRDWVREVERLAPDESALTPETRAAQRYCLAALESRGKAAEAEFDAVIDALGHSNAVAVMMLMGRYVVHALIVNTLALASPVPSIFEDGFEGDG